MGVLILSSLSKNSIAAFFLISAYFGSFMLSVIGVADICSRCMGLRPTLFLAEFNIFNFCSWVRVGVGVGWVVSLFKGVFGVFDWVDGPLYTFIRTASYFG